jgi:predicted ATPase
VRPLDLVRDAGRTVLVLKDVDGEPLDRLLGGPMEAGRFLNLAIAVAAAVGKGGVPELVLVSGYSGIGKSSIINELQRVLVPPRGLFAARKFDQYKHEIPYSTLLQAFQSLIRPLLGKSEADLAPSHEVLRDALGPNAELRGR